MCDRQRKVKKDLRLFPTRSNSFFWRWSRERGESENTVRLSLRHLRCMGINPKKSFDPIIACLSITRPARNMDVLKIQRRAQLYRKIPKSVAIRERSLLRASQNSCLKSLLRTTRAEIKLDTMFAFEITTMAGSRSVCVRIRSGVCISLRNQSEPCG